MIGPNILRYASLKLLRSVVGIVGIALALLFIFELNVGQMALLTKYEAEMATANRILNRIETHRDGARITALKRRPTVYILGIARYLRKRPFVTRYSNPLHLMETSIINTGSLSGQVNRLGAAFELLGSKRKYRVVNHLGIKKMTYYEIDETCKRMQPWPARSSVQVMKSGDIIVKLEDIPSLDVLF